jgi:hypothetical protein
MTNDAVLQELEALMAGMSFEEKMEFAKKLYSMGLEKISSGQDLSQENIRILNNLRAEIKKGWKVESPIDGIPWTTSTLPDRLPAITNRK